MRTSIHVLLAIATLAAGLQGQERPNFSGAWVVVPSRSIWYNDGRPVNITVFGERFTAEQTDRVLSIAIENEGGFKWTYRLDGSASINVVPGPNGAQRTSSTTAWTDSTLIINTTAYVNRNGTMEPAETSRSLRFDKDGTLLVEAPWGLGGAMIGSVYSRER